MALDSYANLQTAIGEWLNNDDLAAAQIKEFIRLVEADLEVDEAILDEVSTTLTVSTATVSLPAACKELKAIYFDETQARGSIDIVPESELAVFKGLHQSTGRPTKAAIINDGRSLKFAPEPDQTYTPIIKYNAFILALSVSQTTNWILTNHPNVYLFGALIMGCKFLKDDDGLARWQGDYDRALDRLKKYVDRRRYSANTLRIRQRRPLDR